MFPAFYLLIGHLSIFFTEIAIQILCPLKELLFVFLLLSFNNSFHVLGTILYQRYDLQTFSIVLWIVFSLP